MWACNYLPGCRNEAELKQWFLDTGTASRMLWVFPGEFYSVLSPAALHLPPATSQPRHGYSCSSGMDNFHINPCISKSNSAGGNSRFQRTFPKFIWIQLEGRIVILPGFGSTLLYSCLTSAWSRLCALAGELCWTAAGLQLTFLHLAEPRRNQHWIFSVAFRSKWAHKAWRRSPCAVTARKSAKRSEQQHVWSTTDPRCDLNPYKTSFSNK